jgi:hypothetical protein
MLGWAVVIYAVVNLAASGLALYQTADAYPTATHIVILAVLIFTLILAGRSLRLHDWHDILQYSLWWAFICAIIDGVYVVPFAGSQIYMDPNLWIGYGLVITVPLIVPYRVKIYQEPHVS